jgi:hypothetical protein
MAPDVEVHRYATSRKRMAIFAVAAALLMLGGALILLDIMKSGSFSTLFGESFRWGLIGLVSILVAIFAVALVAICVQMGRTSNALEVSREGIRDSRVSSTLVPWAAIRKVKVFDLVPNELGPSDHLFHLKSIGLFVDNEGAYLKQKARSSGWLKHLGDDPSRPRLLFLLTGLDANAEEIIDVVAVLAKANGVPMEPNRSTYQ